MSPQAQQAKPAAVVAVVCALVGLSLSGCQDGPLYALKHANPYFTMHQWPSDEQFGVTDHERRSQLADLAATIDSLPPDRQEFWLGHLTQIVENDPSGEMRRLAVNAAGKITAADPRPIIDQGLDDDNVKVRMEACRALGRQPGDDAARSLAATVGAETNEDVRHAAMAALAQHESQIAIDSLRLALKDRNPATRELAMASLRESTGKDFGDDPSVWIAALDGKTVQEQPTRLAERLRNIF